MSGRTREIRRFVIALPFFFTTAVGRAQTPPPCPAVQTEAQTPKDLALCASLETDIRQPAKLRLDQYETKLQIYLRNYCHRNRTAGWRADKHLRDTGPFTLVVEDGKRSGKDFGTHAPVIVWYSPEMLAWLKANRPGNPGVTPSTPAPIPDGAVMVKEMYPAPASTCAGVDPKMLLPTSGAAVMVRDNETSRDGWFWGWFGWFGWKPDWPASPASTYPNMGFGQYCVNCHASARDNQTFASLRNIENEPGEPLAYLSQGQTPPPQRLSHHEEIARATAKIAEAVEPGQASTYLAALGLEGVRLPKLLQVAPLPPATYDNVWARPEGHPLDGFLTSDQCIGCHDAGSTGLQFDMTEQAAKGLLLNLSPYGTWRTSPMGMAGRDPIFLGQLASETGTFHTSSKTFVEDTCFGCHGILGLRALGAASRETGRCRPMTREMLAVTPFPTGDDSAGALANYAGLARDGVSCVACHRMVFGPDAARVHADPQNACLDERRAVLTPGLVGLAASFTGSFDMGAPEALIGPYEKPRETPMKHAIGVRPTFDKSIESAELCGTCHTVHLPILEDGTVVGHTYEQTTYAEWAFSDYRTGATPDGALPLGAGQKAETCQGCHMPGKDGVGHPLKSKIASIQEHSDFPETENALPASEIDLPVRDGVAEHTLVGLNLVFVEMARQYPGILGLPNLDPMLLIGAVAPLAATADEMLTQARTRTATISVSAITINNRELDATVKVANLTGHKFPSGVGFRRAFIAFEVRDRRGAILWTSGQTNAVGVLLDGGGRVLDGEFWWKPDCSARIAPEARRHQPHFEDIDRQDEVQIYEDLSASPNGGPPRACTVAAARGPLTTSFLSRCTRVKDNRLLPSGFLGLEDRARIAASLGAARDLAEEAGPAEVGDDPDYVRGGGDTLHYHVLLQGLAGVPASVEATLYYQSTPPYYLQDRACTSSGEDEQRLLFLASNLQVAGAALANWKLKISTSGQVAVH